MKARKEGRKLVGVSTLTAHASVNFKMNGKGSNADCARSTFKLVELTRLPHNGSQLVENDG